MRINYLKLICLLLILVGCNKDEIGPETTEVPGQGEFITFKLEAKNNPQQLTADVECHIYEDRIVGMIPYTSTHNSLIATFTTASKSVKVNGVIQESGITQNDFTQPVHYTVLAHDSTLLEYTVTLHPITGLPVLYINTENKAPVDSKDDYVKGHMRIEADPQFQDGLFAGEIEIRGRGNSTWEMPKKPYKLKLEEKAGLLGMPADKEWVLLANYSDKTLMRNAVAFELSKRFGLSYTPRSRFVDVILNGVHLGNYLLSEQIKVAEDRVNIRELSEQDTTADLITGGYLMEIDNRLDEGFWFKTKLGLPVTLKEPEDIAPAQLEYIKNYVQATEDAFYAESFADPNEGYAKYINTDTFINWYLVNELVKNTDANFHSSVFMYKDRDGKLSIGPIWDFDIALGNINYNSNEVPEGWWVRDSQWINRLFEDPAFREKVQERWNALKANEINTIDAFIKQTADQLEYSQNVNFMKWNILNTYVWPNAVVLGSYDKEVQYLQEWLSKRISWMDAALNN